MEESHVEGVAIHDGPRSCAAAREVVGEASDRGTCGPGIEPRNACSQVPTPVNWGGRQHGRRRQRETPHGLARSETPCTYGTSLRENREICGPLGAMAHRAASGRP
jgi:hypothetical protein